MKYAKQIREAAMSQKNFTSVDLEKGLSTGSTLLNLACSNDPFSGFLPGRYYFLVGDSASGKTFLSLTCFAEAAKNPEFKNHRLIYDDVEGGNLFDIERLFGKKTAARIEPPEIDKQEGQPVFSSTIEEFYFHVNDALVEGKPFIYVLDSMDGLSSLSEIEKFDETKNAWRTGKTTTGSYGDGKAKINSTNLRRLLAPLRESGSVLIIISQTRDSFSQLGFQTKTRSGGHALRFYATLEIWSSRKQTLKKTVNGKPREIGILSKIQTKKNRITGQEHVIEIPLYHSYGIDDIRSCINYLIEEGRWKKRGQKVQAPDFDFLGTEKELVKKIETEGMEEQIKNLVGDCWNDILEKTVEKRKPRYE